MVWQSTDLLVQPVAQSLPPWTDAAVRDTIAAIAKQAAYQRQIGLSAFSRMWRWLWDRFAEFLGALKEIPFGREIALVLVVLVVLLIVARIILGIRAEE